MTTYRITSSYFCCAIVVDEHTVTQAAPILRWTVGREWSSVRDYFQQKGWSIEPLPESHVEWLDVDDASYQFHWEGNRCIRITKHEEGQEPEDVAFGDLPDEIGGLVE